MQAIIASHAINKEELLKQSSKRYLLGVILAVPELYAFLQTSQSVIPAVNLESRGFFAQYTSMTGDYKPVLKSAILAVALSFSSITGLADNSSSGASATVLIRQLVEKIKAGDQAAIPDLFYISNNGNNKEEAERAINDLSTDLKAKADAGNADALRSLRIIEETKTNQETWDNWLKNRTYGVIDNAMATAIIAIIISIFAYVSRVCMLPRYSQKKAKATISVIDIFRTILLTTLGITVFWFNVYIYSTIYESIIPKNPDRLVEKVKTNISIEQLAVKKEEGDSGSVDALKKLVESENKNANTVIKDVTLQGLVAKANAGDGNAVEALKKLAEAGNEDAKADIKDIIPLGFVAKANAGNGNAVDVLKELAEAGNKNAKVAMKIIDPQVFVQRKDDEELKKLAEAGNENANIAIKDISLRGFVAKANAGDLSAIYKLKELAEAGNEDAKAAIKYITLQGFVAKANKGDDDAIESLKELAEAGNEDAKAAIKDISPQWFVAKANEGDSTAVSKVLNLAEAGNEKVKSAMKYINPKGVVARVENFGYVYGNKWIITREGLDGIYKVDELQELAKAGNEDAKYAIKNLNPKGYITQATVADNHALNSNAVNRLKELADAGNENAKVAMKIIDPQVFVQKKDDEALKKLAEAGNEKAFEELEKLAESGDYKETYAVYNLKELAELGNEKAIDAIKYINPRHIVEDALRGLVDEKHLLNYLAEAGNKNVINSLQNLADRGQGGVYILYELAKAGNENAKVAMKDINPNRLVATATEVTVQPPPSNNHRGQSRS